MSYRLIFEPAAESGYAKLPGGRVIGHADDILDQLEFNPGDKTVRKHRYLMPNVFGVDFTANGEDWVLLWSMARDGREEVVVIHYIGLVPRGPAGR
jgi:hypothetical protein